MPLAAVHTVELHLIMQACDMRSLLAFARCSKQFRKAASNEFAFRSLSPLLVQAREGIETLLSASLIRYCDVTLEMPSLAADILPVVLHSFRAAVRTVPRLRGIVRRSQRRNFSDDEAESRIFLGLFAHPNLRGVTSLDMEAMFLGEQHMQRIVTHLPQLTSIRVSEGTLEQASIALLPSICKLRHISLNDGDDSDEDSHAWLHPLTACSELRSLHLFAWRPILVARLLAPVSFAAHLVELALIADQSPKWVAFAGESWHRVFESLTSLQRLTLDRCAHCSATASAAVAQCRRLSWLLLRPSPFDWLQLWSTIEADTPEYEAADDGADDGSQVPSAADVARIIEMRQHRISEADHCNHAVSPLRIQLWMLDRAYLDRLSGINSDLRVAEWKKRIRRPYARLLTTEADASVRFDLIEEEWIDMRTC